MLVNFKINIKKILLAAVIYVVVATVLRQIEVLFTMKYYFMPELSDVWSKLMMPKAGPPPASFFVLSLSFTFLAGLVLVIIYEWIKSILPKKFWLRVLFFTKLIVMIMLVFGYLPMYLTMNVPTVLIMIWFITGTLSILVGTVCFVKILK